MFVLLEKNAPQNSLETRVYIKNELKKKVPSYMVPRKINILDKFQINSNGKVDRKKILMKNTLRGEKKTMKATTNFSSCLENAIKNKKIICKNN